MFSPRHFVASLLFLTWLFCAASSMSAAEPASPSTASESTVQRAIHQATSTLAKQLNLDASTFKIISTEPHTWNDSSLGCSRPGTMTAQIIATGYIVTIATSKGTHQVNATEKYATTCERNMITRNPHEIEVPLKNLGGMISKARMDLATKLNVKQSQIRTVSFQSTEWPDTSMNCVIEGEMVENKITKGYRIALNYAGRIYVYYTDMERVRACPAIDVQ